MPWETGSTQGKYQYHPGGDASAPPKDAPSAVNVVVVPDVNLPKVRVKQIAIVNEIASQDTDWFLQHLHDKYNKWGKEGY